MAKKQDQKSAELKHDHAAEQIESLEQQLKRVMADYQNLQRRMALEKEAYAKWASQSVIVALLPIIDTVEKVCETTPKEEQQSAWFPVVQLTVKQLKELLEKEGVKEIDPVGEQFDNTMHEVIDVIPGDKENTIAAVLQKGYSLNDKVIRAARVQVIKKSA